MKVAAYVRVSSRHQKTDSQESEIKKWLEGNGIAADQVLWYRDVETGKTLDRPAFNRLQQDIFTGMVKTVVVWKLDRLSRRLRDGVNLLADWCERGLKIVIVTQQIELNGPVGRMIAAVLLGLAEIELEFRRERRGCQEAGRLPWAAKRHDQEQASTGAGVEGEGVDRGRSRHRARRQREDGVSLPGPVQRPRRP